MMAAFCECRDCGFVLRSNDGSSPKHWDECPGCGGTDFVPIEE